ncbi:MAG TPA: DUF72 domain-containing protein [Bryobacteraceae bacterium]|nr:DUF72 domain-containing protein [Bryobacteraceae bacterium]
MGKVWIGTSGWHYKHWLGPFYPPALSTPRMLRYYTGYFDTVELNNTFYKLPAPASLSAWRDSTPEGFHFAVKGSRFLTHMKKLNNAEAGLKKFLDAACILGPKLGPILFQLPPNWEINLERLDAFLALLPRGVRCAFEFRNATWNIPRTYELLTRYHAAYCIYDLAGYLSRIEITADFTYVRLHGPGGKYQGSYSNAALQEWARKISDWQRALSAVYVYFDNDDSGHAPRDALRLRELACPNRPLPRSPLHRAGGLARPME